MERTKLEREGSPTGWKRLLFRAPIPLYRARLGFLFGHRFVLLEHTGRNTGETRRTVLESVVDDPDAVYVAAAWGAEAQWLKNVGADPRVVFHLGSRRYRCDAERVSHEAARALMSRYAMEHPRALQALARFMLDDPGSGPLEQASQIATHIPMVRLSKTRDA